MDDASDEHSIAAEMPVPVENGVILHELENTKESDSSKCNGDTNSEDSDSENSSDCATNVTNTDTENGLKRKLVTSSPESSGRRFKKLRRENDFVPPTNPYFNESLFELSALHQTPGEARHAEEKKENGSMSRVQDSQEPADTLKSSEITTRSKRLIAKKKKLPPQKFIEQPQFLGLQPVIRFKCRKCGQSGFPSLLLLREHFKHCTGEPVAIPKADSSQKLLVTRRNVFLCSACGCYYENYNLFLHIFKVHQRLVCLYCSAVFSQTEKFLFHLLHKHNCVPGQLNTEKEFFEAHKQPCYLMCCDCEKIFGDEGEEHFFGHICNSSKIVKKDSKNKLNNKIIVNNHKNTKSKGKSKGFVEHVTADTEAPIVTNSDPIDVPVTDDCVKECKEEVKSNLSPGVAAETENDTDLVAMEMVKNESDTNLSIKEESINVPNCKETEDSANENDQLVSEDDLDDKPDTPDHVLEDQSDEDQNKTEEPQETRKVPKVTLKIRKPPSFEDADIQSNEDTDDDDDKLTMQLDTMDCQNSVSEEKECEDTVTNPEATMNVAGVEIPVIELKLEQPLDKFEIQVLLQKCLTLTIPTCVYCNYARKISVNGKQLGLHAIAEHRFSAVVNSITAEELIPESFVMRIKDSLTELQDTYFSLESSPREEGSTFARNFECFQCRYSTNVHKELYLHNRKMHAKTILLCIMCKSNFYSYSELICHMCPGLYELNKDINYQCCICDADDLPSAFRLMVHLRKRHHACDVCLELCHNQSRLSNHVWKHKLHHFCYRCGIAYRNKPDITKHLFWKHGTESVLCKKCLQKKWPHVYHFCMPPSTFTCEECNLNFNKAVSLKVHKRLHSHEKPHTCTVESCTETFISKKLLLKHEFKHREPLEILENKISNSETKEMSTEDAPISDIDVKENEGFTTENVKDESKPKPKVDVLDLPALNLSESDSSDSEDELNGIIKPYAFNLKLLGKSKEEDVLKTDDSNSIDLPIATCSSFDPPVPALENIWDNFKNYQAQKGKPNSDVLSDKIIEEGDKVVEDTKVEETTFVQAKHQKQLVEAIMQDHDYSLLSQEYKNNPHGDLNEATSSADHDYCTSKKKSAVEKITEQPTTSKDYPKKDLEKEKSFNSSSDSDSSSCSCGPDCSCSSGSSSSSSVSSDSDSSTSEGRRKQQIRREQRRLRSKVKKESEKSHIDVVAPDVTQAIVPSVELIIEETDLETSESDTDEEFYDKQPQKLANKILAEKRKELIVLAEMGPLVNGTVLETSRPSTPSLPETEVVKLKPKKSKSKKKKKKSKKRGRIISDTTSSFYQYPTVSPLSISLPKNSPMSIQTPLMTPPILSTLSAADFNSDLSNTSDSLRASKRRRIPNKFYGYSSDEEQDKQEKLEKHQPPVLKWRKSDLPSPAPPPLLVPPITLKAIPAPVVEQEPAPVQPSFHHPHPALFKPKAPEHNESNDSTSEDEQAIPNMNRPLNQPPLYCYCRCPYDEVSEMIGCDADDCLIEWFHFECVGIMVPPKGQWFCPDCRKKRQQQKELSQL